MATNYTANYGLCQWEPQDSFTRTEFNQDNAKIDVALGRTERGMEANRSNLYNLLLQRDYEGKYTGWKQALIFDGFQDDSKIESITDNMVLSTAGNFLFLNGKTSESENVNFGNYAGITLQPGESLSETWTCDRMGWATALRLYMSGHGTLVITNGSGTFTRTEVKGSTGSAAEEVAFPWGLTLDPGETYTFTYTATTQSVLYRAGSGQFGYRVMLTYVPQDGTGILVTKSQDLGISTQSLRATVRSTICVGISLSVYDGENWLPMTHQGTVGSYTLQGVSCSQRSYTLELSKKLSSLSLCMEVSTISPVPVDIFDYAVVAL